MQNNILNQLTSIKTENETEQAILTDLLTIPDPQGDDLLSHIECTYNYPRDEWGYENLTGSPLNYQDGIDFLTKYNLIP